MLVPVRLMPVDPMVLSSYQGQGGVGGPRATLRPLHTLTGGVAHPDTVRAIKALHEAVQAAGGDLRVTECHRDVAVQQAARAKYDLWLSSGKPKPGSAGFNPKTMKAAFVAIPGKSMHNAGRAIDFHVSELKFPNVPANKQLDRMWEIMRPLGWSSVIQFADEGASESWHVDYWGDLQGVRARLGYEQAALAGALLVGHAGQWQSFERAVQALVHRAGYAIGDIDGVIGPKTLAALAQGLRMSEAAIKAKISAKDTTLYTALLSLPAK